MSLYIKLSCDALTDDKIIAVGPIGFAVYVRGLLYAKQHLTDGLIPSNAMAFIMQSVHHPQQVVDRLLLTKLWIKSPDGYCVPPDKWARYQTTKSQVEEKQAYERQRKAEYRARRRGCPAPVPMGHDPLSRPCPGPVPALSEPEPEPEPYLSTPIPPSLSRTVQGAADAACDDIKNQNQGEDLFGGIEPKKAKDKTPKADASESKEFKAVKAAWKDAGLDRTENAWEARGSQGYSSKGTPESVIRIAKAEGIDRLCQSIYLYRAKLIDNFQYNGGRQQAAQAFSTFFGPSKATWREFIERVPQPEVAQ